MKILVKMWLNFLMPTFFGIGEGPSQAEYQQYGALGNIGSFASSTGEKDIGAASDFWNAIISGDQTQLSRALGPLYSNISKRGGEQLKTLQEFGTRSGGTAAEGQRIGDEMRSEASSAEGALLGQAASSLGGLGSGLLSTGLSAHEAAFGAAQTIQQQKQAKLNDIFKSIADITSSFIPGGGGFNFVKGLFGGGGGGQNMSPYSSTPGNIS
jgi:hypothetical protein